MASKGKGAKGAAKKGASNTASVAAELEICLCHNDRLMACVQCADQASSEISSLTAEDVVSIPMKEIECKLKLIPCVPCREAALAALPSLTSLFVTYQPALPAPPNPEAEAEAAESQEQAKSASKKKKKGKDASSGGDGSEGSSTAMSAGQETTEKAGEEAGKDAEKAAVAVAPPAAKPEGRWLVRVESGDATVLRFKLNPKRKAQKEQVPAAVETSKSTSAESTAEQQTTSSLEESQVGESKTDALASVELGTEEDTRGSEDVPKLKTVTAGSLIQRQLSLSPRDDYKKAGIKGVKTDAVLEMPRTLVELSNLRNSLARRAFVLGQVVLEAGQDLSATELTSSFVTLVTLQDIGVVELMNRAEETVDMVAKSVEAYDDMVVHLTKYLFQGFSLALFSVGDVLNFTNRLQEISAKLRDQLCACAQQFRLIMESKIRLPATRQLLQIMGMDPTSSNAKDNDVTSVFKVWTAVARLKVSMRLAEIMRDGLFHIIDDARACEFGRSSVGRGGGPLTNEDYMHAGDLPDDVFYALKIGEAAKTVLEMFDVSTSKDLTIEDLPELQKWIGQTLDKLTLDKLKDSRSSSSLLKETAKSEKELTEKEKDKEKLDALEKLKKWEESLKQHDEAAPVFALDVSKRLRERLVKINQKRKSYLALFETELVPASLLPPNRIIKVFKNSDLQDALSNLAMFAPLLFSEDCKQPPVNVESLDTKMQKLFGVMADWLFDHKRRIHKFEDQPQKTDKLELVTLVSLACETDTSTASMRSSLLLSSYVGLRMLSALSRAALASNPSLGCVRACQSEAERKELGLRRVSRHVGLLIVPRITEAVSLARLVHDQTLKEAKDKKRKEAEDKKKAEERDREMQKRAAEEARRKQEKREQEEREDQARKEREEKERQEAEERARRETERANQQALESAQWEGEFQERRPRDSARTVIKGGRRVVEVRPPPAPPQQVAVEEPKLQAAVAPAKAAPAVSQEWACTLCTFANKAQNAACEICMSPRPAHDPQPLPVVESQPKAQQPSSKAQGTPQPQGKAPAASSTHKTSAASHQAPSAAQSAKSNAPKAPPVQPQQPPVVVASVPAAPKESSMAPPVSKVMGLSNNTGENSCFLNVVVQSLWHLRTFSQPFLAGSSDDHLCSRYQNLPCIVCSLRSTFSQLADSKESLVSSVEMRQALFAAFDNVFSLGEKHDAGEALERVLTALHFALTGEPEEADESGCRCMVHRCFGSSFTEGVRCGVCKKKAEAGTFDVAKFTKEYDCILSHRLVLVQGYSSYVRYVSASLIAELGDGFPNFKERLQAAMDVEPVSCPVCDKKGLEIERVVTQSSAIYTLGIVWQSHKASSDEIKTFLEAVSEHLDVSFESQTGTVAGTAKLCVLRGMMCYYGSHYAAFFRPSPESNPDGAWYMFDDSVVREVGRSWTEAARACYSNRFQPVALFYEADQSLVASECSFVGVNLEVSSNE